MLIFQCNASKAVILLKGGSRGRITVKIKQRFDWGLIYTTTPPAPTGKFKKRILFANGNQCSRKQMEVNK